MKDNDSPAPAFTEIQAVRILLEKMGVNPADLQRAPTTPPEVPLFADYIPRVSKAVSSGTRRVYSSYWNRVIDAWGPRRITEVTAMDISQLAEQVKVNVVERRTRAGGAERPST